MVPLFAARSRHEKPYPPMSRINSTFPFSIPFKGNVEEYTPFPRRFQAGIAVLGNCRLQWAGRPQGISLDSGRAETDRTPKTPRMVAGQACAPSRRIPGSLGRLGCPGPGISHAKRLSAFPATGPRLSMRRQDGGVPSQPPARAFPCAARMAAVPVKQHRNQFPGHLAVPFKSVFISILRLTSRPPNGHPCRGRRDG